MCINEEESNQTDSLYNNKNKENHTSVSYAYYYNIKGIKEHYSTTVVEKNDIITSKDIQNKNPEITWQFETFSINFIGDEDRLKI